MAKISATINYEVRLKDKVQQFLERFAQKIDRELTNVQIERYWKIASQYQARFEISAHSTHREGLVFETLQVANTLHCGQWIVNGPYETEGCFFECFYNNEEDNQPLKWSHLELDDKVK